MGKEKHGGLLNDGNLMVRKYSGRNFLKSFHRLQQNLICNQWIFFTSQFKNQNLNQKMKLTEFNQALYL